MNQTTPYEKIIAEKLHELPVPDMADSIWARIEAELDAGVQQEDPAKEPGDKPGSGRSFPGQRLAVIVTAVAVFTSAVFLINKATKKKMREDAPGEMPKQEEQIILPVDSLKAIPLPGIIPPANSPVFPMVKDTTSSMVEPLFPIDADPGITPAVPVIDTPMPAISLPVQQPPTPAPQNKPGIGQKGMKDINDQDYRIKGSKNDSTKNE